MLGKELRAETLERLYELFIQKINNLRIHAWTGLWPVDTLTRCQQFIQEEHIGRRNCYDHWHRAECAVMTKMNDVWYWTSEGLHWVNRFEDEYRESFGLPKARTRIGLGGVQVLRSSVSSADSKSESLHRCDSETTLEVYSSSLGSEMDSVERMELERRCKYFCDRTYPDNSNSPSSNKDDDDGSDDDSCLSSDDDDDDDDDDKTASKQSLVADQTSLDPSADNVAGLAWDEVAEETATGNGGGIDEAIDKGKTESSSERENSGNDESKSRKYCNDGDTDNTDACNVGTSEFCLENGSSSSSGLSFLVGGGRKRGRTGRSKARKKILDDSDSE